MCVCSHVGGRIQYNLSHATPFRCQIFAFVQHFLVPAWKLEVSLVSPCQIVSRYKKHLGKEGGWPRYLCLLLESSNMGYNQSQSFACN